MPESSDTAGPPEVALQEGPLLPCQAFAAPEPSQEELMGLPVWMLRRYLRNPIRTGNKGMKEGRMEGKGRAGVHHRENTIFTESSVRKYLRFWNACISFCGSSCQPLFPLSSGTIGRRLVSTSVVTSCHHGTDIWTGKCEQEQPVPLPSLAQ